MSAAGFSHSPTTTALLLGLVTDRAEPARRVVGAAAIVGLVTIVVNLFG